jgi:hypothetical protein
VLALGWSARDLLLLYFADTLAGCWAAVAAVLAWAAGADRHERVRDGLHSLAAAAAGALALVPFLAVPLGMPLLFTLGPPTVEAWRGLMADRGFVAGLAGIALAAVVTTVRHLLALAAGGAGHLGVKQAFGILLTRWLVVLVAAYWGAALLGRGAPVFLLAVYAAATAWSELQPGRFATLLPGRRPGAAAGPPGRPAPGPRRRR